VIGKGEAWERPAAGPPERMVRGGDAELAAAVAGSPGVRIGVESGGGGDLLRALGLGVTAHAPAPAGAPAHDLAVDGLRVRAAGEQELFGVNLLVLGTPPDRLTAVSRRATVTVVVDGRVVHDGPAVAVVVANGQYLRGADIVPRGHPGDGRVEVQVYHPRRGEAGAVRRRLALGTHLPHPRITQVSGRAIEVTATRRLPLELDGRARAATDRISVTVLPAHFVVVL
jgi:hypothetical protein